MAAAVTIASTAASRRYRPDEFGLLSIDLAAFDAEIGLSQVPIPDPTGADAIVGGRNVTIVDGSTTFLDGFVSPQHRERGAAPTAPSLLHQYSVQDTNALLYGFVAKKWARPEETDEARVLAMNTDFALGFDTTWVLGTHLATLPAKTYDTDNLAGELVSDLTDIAGKTLFARSTGGVRYLHCHLLTEGPPASITIDDTATAPYTSAFPPGSPSTEKAEVSWDRDPLDLAYTIVARGQGTDEVTVTDATSKSAHNADGRQFEALVSFPDAADITELTALANNLLATRKLERDTYHCRIGPLTAAQAAGIGPGFLVTVTSQVLGLTASTQRIAHITWTYKHPGLWYADLELGAPLRLPKPPKGKPAVPPCTDEDGAALTATIEAQAFGTMPGRWIDAYGVIKTGGGASIATGEDTGWRYGSGQLVVLGYQCPAGEERAAPTELHLVLRFDTRALTKYECLNGARLDYGVHDPDCACGPYELAHHGAFMATSGVSLATFRKGTPIGTIDLSQATQYTAATPPVLVPFTYDVPTEALNPGGYTYLVLRPKWTGGCAVACGEGTDCAGTPQSIASGLVKKEPCNVHRATLGDMTPTLTLKTTAQLGCQSGWMDAVCPSASAGTPPVSECPGGVQDCSDPCCVQWWRVPCGTYKPGTLQVMCGGRILQRGSTHDFAESSNRRCFKLLKPCCETPKVRYVVWGVHTA